MKVQNEVLHGWRLNAMSSGREDSISHDLLDHQILFKMTTAKIRSKICTLKSMPVSIHLLHSSFRNYPHTAAATCMVSMPQN